MAVKLLKRLTLALGGMTLLSGMLSIAAEPSNDQLVTETFSLPPAFYGLGYLNHPMGYGPDFKNYVLELPPDYAHKELEKIGVTFPENTLLLLDAEWGTLTARNTPENLAKIRQHLSNQIEAVEPVSLNFTTHLIQAPGPLLRMLAQAAGENKDQAQDLQRLLTEANTPESPVKVLHTAHLGCRMSQWVELDNVFEKGVCTGLPLDAQGRVTVDTDFHPAGLRLKASPDHYVQGRSHKSIRINLSPNFTWPGPVQPKERLTEPVTGSVMEWPVPNYQQAHLQTSLSLRHGQTMLVGQWPVKEAAVTDRADQARAFFITAHILDPAPTTTKENLSAPAFFSAPDKEETQWSTSLPPAFLNEHSLDELTHAEKLLKKHDLSIPEKSSATLSSSGTLTVRSDPATLAQVYAWAQKVKASRRSDLATTLEVYRAPASFFRSLLARHAPSSNHSEALAEVRRATEAREAQFVTRSSVNNRGGQWTQLTAGHDHRYIHQLSWRKTGPPLFESDSRIVGLTMKMSAEFEMGDLGAVINYDLEQHTSPQTVTRELLKDPASQQSFYYPHSHFQTMRIKSADHFEFGVPKIIGVWQKTGTDGLQADEFLEIAFLTCNRIPIWGRLPLRHTDLLTRAGATPGTNEPMLTRLFKVFPEFGTTYERTLRDPFETNPAVPSKQRLLTVQETLESEGISFPPGSKAVSAQVTNTIMVTNTAANLDLVETLLSRFNTQPKTLRFTLHVIEADASQIQSLADQYATVEDHTPVLEALLEQVKTGQAAVQATLALSTLAGQRASAAEEQEEPSLVGIRVNDRGGSEIDHEQVTVGSSFEVDPVVGPDGVTIVADVDLSHHTAPPIKREVNLATDDAPPVLVPLTDFHLAKVSASLTLTSGTARILSIWEPTGRPDAKTSDRLQIAILQGKASNAEE